MTLSLFTAFSARTYFAAKRMPRLAGVNCGRRQEADAINLQLSRHALSLLLLLVISFFYQPTFSIKKLLCFRFLKSQRTGGCLTCTF